MGFPGSKPARPSHFRNHPRSAPAYGNVSLCTEEFPPIKLAYLMIWLNCLGEAADQRLTY